MTTRRNPLTGLRAYAAELSGLACAGSLWLTACDRPDLVPATTENAAALETTTIATVDGAPVSLEEFNRRYTAAVAPMAARHGCVPPVEAAQHKLRIAAALIDEALVLREAVRRGLVPDAGGDVLNPTEVARVLGGDRAPPVTDAMVAEYYAENTERWARTTSGPPAEDTSEPRSARAFGSVLPAPPLSDGTPEDEIRPLAQVAPQVRAYLAERRRVDRVGALLQTLRAEAEIDNRIEARFEPFVARAASRYPYHVPEPHRCPRPRAPGTFPVPEPRR